MYYQFYVYILKCHYGKLYTGFTNNLDRRLTEHQQGLNKSAFTYKRRPLALIFSQEFNDVFQAKSFERRIKKWSSKKKLALASGDYDKLRLLSICQNDTSSAFVSMDYVPKRIIE
ncbi:MAG: GIY-YIG nuclease family protein [Winogradskyella sp.]|uniref:GIY-YIG nuclease family protein n=1 Tax=Winogradskyella sp. TaxID=1883156 RepID=UPI0017DC89B8|nr:GIY-YIG nuclease family protein [Winogradskyella sp.]NNK22789.1 GIY-YIG nuclease family protein [Winogradskyella sp.]